MLPPLEAMQSDSFATIPIESYHKKKNQFTCDIG